MRRVIALSRQYGSGGEEIGRRLAEKLGFPYMDREIVSRAAALAGVSEQTIQEAERAQSFLERMVELLGRYPLAAELGAPLPDLPPTPPLTTDTYRKLIEDVIRSVAERGGAVIVGHGGQIVLREDPRALRALVCAPLERRVAHLMAREGVDAEEARRRITEQDTRISEYLRTYYKVNWLDPLLYDLVLNTDRLEVDTAVTLLLRAAGSQEG
jgi:cytidylate kinase